MSAGSVWACDGAQIRGAGLGVITIILSGISTVGRPSGHGAPNVGAEANALRAQIHRYHAGPGMWTGSTPPPAGYCGVLAPGNKELVYLANRAVGRSAQGVVPPLQRAADALGDELDHEEEINNQAGFNYDPNGYPCPAASSPFARRAAILYAVNQRMPGCRRRPTHCGSRPPRGAISCTCARHSLTAVPLTAALIARSSAPSILHRSAIARREEARPFPQGRGLRNQRAAQQWARQSLRLRPRVNAGRSVRSCPPRRRTDAVRPDGSECR